MNEVVRIDPLVRGEVERLEGLMQSFAKREKRRSSTMKKLFATWAGFVIGCAWLFSKIPNAPQDVQWCATAGAVVGAFLGLFYVMSVAKTVVDEENAIDEAVRETVSKLQRMGVDVTVRDVVNGRFNYRQPLMVEGWS